MAIVVVVTCRPIRRISNVVLIAQFVLNLRIDLRDRVFLRDHEHPAAGLFRQSLQYFLSVAAVATLWLRIATSTISSAASSRPASAVPGPPTAASTGPTSTTVTTTATVLRTHPATAFTAREVDRVHHSVRALRTLDRPLQ